MGDYCFKFYKLRVLRASVFIFYLEKVIKCLI